jgi:DNA-binding NtrC family response regulator
LRLPYHGRILEEVSMTNRTDGWVKAQPLDFEVVTGSPVGVPGEDRVRPVLVIDRDPGVRNVARSVLEGEGFRVLLGSSSTEARCQVCEHGLELVAMVYDVDAGDLDVAATVQLLAEMSPAAVIVTGTPKSDEAVRRIAEISNVKAFLRKPYTAEDLVGAVNTAIRFRHTAAAGGPRARFGIAHRS